VCVCMCEFVCLAPKKLCSSHCQSQITNDTNSPRALTISTLAALTLSSQHRHTHAYIRIAYALKRSLTHLLAHSHARFKDASSQPKGGSTTDDNETKRNPTTKPIPDAPIKAGTVLSFMSSSTNISGSLHMCACVRL